VLQAIAANQELHIANSRLSVELQSLHQKIAEMNVQSEFVCQLIILCDQSLVLDHVSDNLDKSGKSVHCLLVITCKRGSAAVVRTSCCSYGKHQILHLSRAETTEAINTKF